MKYPNIESAILNMAACNGALHRLTTNEEVLTRGMSALQADGVLTEDVDALEIWIGTLNEEQKEILVDGEEEERAALVAESPTSVLGGCVGQLLDDVWEAL